MNVLFLMADEFRYDVAGFMGNKVARTPRLDQLAAESVVFDAAYTPSPICVPGRQCLATGRYPQRAGCLSFYDDIAPNSPTFARWFSERGYYTTACGKLHHRGPDQMQGWLHRIGAETAVKWPVAYSERSQIGRRSWQGAEEVKEAGPGISPLAIHDDYTVQGAKDFLRVHFGGLYPIPSETPLMLMVSLQQPHFPLRTTQELFDYYYNRVELYRENDDGPHPALNAKRLGTEQGVSNEDMHRATAAYYGMVEQTDRRLGSVLDTLEEMGQKLEDWIVVFTSDHGEMLGEHGCWEKRKFYEGSVRVPLFIRAPQLAPRRESQLANLIDLFPTLSALAGLGTPPDVDGRDLFTEPPAEATFSQLGKDQFMVRSGVLKFMRFADGGEVLFDLAADPGENTNFIGEPAFAHQVAKMRGLLEEFLIQQRAGRRPSGDLSG